MTSKKFTIELKDLIIIILILFCLWIYFRPQKNNLKELEIDNNAKQKQYESIQKQRDSLLNERKLIDLELVKQKKLASTRADTIRYYREISKSKENEIILLNTEIKSYQQLFDKKSKEIDKLIENPIIIPKNKIIEKISEKL